MHPLEKFCDRLAIDLKIERGRQGYNLFVLANEEAEFKDSLVTCVYDAPTLQQAMDELWQIFKDAFYLAEK